MIIKYVLKEYKRDLKTFFDGVCFGESTLMGSSESTKTNYATVLSGSLFMWTSKKISRINFDNTWCCNQQWGDEGEKISKDFKERSAWEWNPLENLNFPSF